MHDPIETSDSFSEFVYMINVAITDYLFISGLQ